MLELAAAPENEILPERDILKKATVFFARRGSR